MAEPRETPTAEVSLARIAWSLKELVECAKKDVAIKEQLHGAAPEPAKKQWSSKRDEGF